MSTPLLLAVEQGHLDVAKKLIKKGASITDQNTNGEMPLYLALLQSDAEMTQLLVEKLTAIDLNHKALTPQVRALALDAPCDPILMLVPAGSEYLV